jgi:simple sugar transport system permease protein
MSADPAGFSGSEDKSPASYAQEVEEASTGAAAAEPGAGTDEPGAPKGKGGFSIRRVIDDIWTTNPVTTTVLAFLLAMAIGGILIIISDPTVTAKYGYFFAAPGDALAASWDAVSSAYANLFKGSIVDPSQFSAWLSGDAKFTSVIAPLSETLTFAAPLVFTGLAVALAFRGGLFNIGAQGQAIFGAIAAGLAGFALHLPVVIHLIVVIIAAAVGGAFYGFIPGILKARTGAHEVITTIMLNNIALLFLGWFITQHGIQAPNRTDAISKDVDGHAQLPQFFAYPLRVNLGIVLALLTAAAVTWILNRSTFGFELRAVGLNPDAARTAGMSVAGTYIATMTLSGVLAGWGGAAVLLGTATHLTVGVVGNIGFQGITVALLGRGKPWGVVLAGILFGALNAGGNRMQSFDQIPVDMVDVLTSLIVLFVAAPALIREIFRLRAARSGRIEANLAKGW